MSKTIKTSLLCLVFCCAGALQVAAKMTPLPVALNLGFSGSMQKYAQNAKNAAELAIKKIEEGGGIPIGGKKYTIKLIITDNKEDPSTAITASLTNISKDRVLAIVGPLTSNPAISMSGLMDSYKIPMITPWAASSKITVNRKYVYRLSVGSIIQAQTVAKFALENWDSPKVAILYDELGVYSSGTAEMFQRFFADTVNKDAITAIETFRAENTDAEEQLKKIAGTNPSFIFLPVSPEQALAIIKQAVSLGIKTPFIGGDWWNSAEFAKKCGSDCNGFTFAATFVPKGAKGAAKKFVTEYKAAYGSMPTEEAALTYDAVTILGKALAAMPKISGNILQDRKELNKRISALKNVDMVTGKVSYNGYGEPQRCALFVTMKDGELLQDKYVCP